MPTPVEFMKQYRNLKVKAVMDDSVARVCREVTYRVQVKKYFMMNWTEGTEQKKDYDAVTRGSKKNVWFNTNKERIRNAAMGKGAPRDYALALEWAVLSDRVKNLSQGSLQTYCNNHLGIDCSGFVTNYLNCLWKESVFRDHRAQYERGVLLQCGQSRERPDRSSSG